MSILSHKNRLGDGKINTTAEMIEAEEEKLWEHNNGSFTI